MNLVDLKQRNPQFVVNESGERTAVILPIAVFEELLEDIQDLTALVERRDEPTIPHDDLLADLKKIASYPLIDPRPHPQTLFQRNTKQPLP